MNIIDSIPRLIAALAIALLILLSGCLEKERKPLPCLERTVFGDPSESPYILSYAVGDSYRLMQGYCYPKGGHRNQLACDFETPLGTQVISARSVIVIMKIRSDLLYDGKQPESGQHNHIMIKHDDGTVAFYAHLMQDSILVKLGDRVSQGQAVRPCRPGPPSVMSIAGAETKSSSHHRDSHCSNGPASQTGHRHRTEYA